MRNKLFLCLLCVLCGNAFAIIGDVTGDDTVDVEDLIFADEWLTEGTLCNFDGSGLVDFIDFALLAENWQGHLLSPPGKAANPNPTNEATNISITSDLSWTAANAESYDVYFGTANPPILLDADYAETDYDISVLNYNTVYYWRIDSKNEAGTTAGDVWSFTTIANTPPVVSDITLDANAFETKRIKLISTDDGVTPVIYYIKQTADTLQDPASGGGIITKVPHKIINGDDTVWLNPLESGQYVFKWCANDEYGCSPDANCFITVAENPRNCVSLNIGGVITIPDNSIFDLAHGKGIGVCFITRKPYQKILLKRETGKPGYEMEMIAGRIAVNIYDANGVIATIKSIYRYDTGVQVNCVFGFNITNHKLELYISTTEAYYASTWLMDGEVVWDDGAVDVPTRSIYANDCDLIIGGNFKGQIDAIRAYTLDMTDNFRVNASLQRREYAGNTESYVPSPSVRFKCDESEGDTIASDITAGLTGSLSGDVFWTPENPFWQDINVLRYRR